MTKPVTSSVPKPQFRSADYSLRYQVMLDTLNSQQAPGVTPLQLNVSPPGVNDLNRPMLINTTASKWRDLGLGSSITRPKYQRRRIGEPVSKEELEHQLRKEEDLIAMSRLLQEATGQEKENLHGGPRVASGRGGGGEKGQNVKRSRSEPMHLPPIDEGQTPPGFRKHATPSYAQSRSRAGLSPGGYAESVNKRQQRCATASRADSRTALPTLSKVKEEKNRYVDSCFLRGVQRHTGRMNMNLAMGKPPRVPRHSWEDGRARSSIENQHGHPPNSQHQNTHYNNDNKNAEPCEVPLRLRDMDLGVFPIRKKMESVRQWHEDQFRKHLEQWKQNGNSEGTDKHAEALELLAKYKQRENRINNILGTTSTGHTPGHSPRTEQNQNNIDSSAEPNQGAHNQMPTTPKVLPPPRTSHSNREALRIPEETLKESGTEGIAAEGAGKTPRVAKALLDVDWTGLNHKPIKGAKVQQEAEYVYKDAKTYIEDNDLLPPDKCRRIQDWVNNAGLTSDCSACTTPSDFSLTSNCSSHLDSDSEDDSEELESAVQ